MKLFLCYQEKTHFHSAAWNEWQWLYWQPFQIVNKTQKAVSIANLSMNIVSWLSSFQFYPIECTISSNNLSPMDIFLGARKRIRYISWSNWLSKCILRNTYTKIGTIQRRLAWPLRKDDTQIREAFHIFFALNFFVTQSVTDGNRFQLCSKLQCGVCWWLNKYPGVPWCILVRVLQLL